MFPKVACSNWKCVLRYLEGHDNYLDTNFAHEKSVNGLTYLMDQPDPWRLLRDTGIKKITFIRNPFSRALSAYLNKVESNLPYLLQETESDDFFFFVTKEVEKFRQESLDAQKFPKVNFKVFLLWVQHGPEWLRENEHWKNQCELTLPHQVNYDLVGRFENLAEDVSKALEMMGCDIAFPSQGDIKFPPTSAISKLDHYYDAGSISIVRELYGEDFGAFAYDELSVTSHRANSEVLI